MSDFSQPVYASYIALCTDLQIDRRPFRRSDWWVNLHERSDRHPMVIDDTEADSMATIRDLYCWLPSLSDWLEMLDSEGHELYTIVRSQGGWMIDIGIKTDPHIPNPTLADKADSRWVWRGRAVTPSREESAARLWMVVTKQKTPSHIS
jgi:hypothetical protein